jgi:hypothetical protein
VSKEYAYCYLSDISTFSTHIGASDDLQIGFIPLHSAVIIDARSWVKHVDQRMLAFNKIDLLSILRADYWLRVLIS